MENNTKIRRRFKVVLAVSLGLNLLFVGLVAGAFWRGGGKGGPHGRGVDRMQYAMPYVRALPRDAQQELQSALRQKHPRMGRKMRLARHQEMLAALRATPFDPAAAEAVLDAQGQLGLGIVQSGQAELMARITAMTQAERMAYADRLQEQMARRAKRWKAKRGG